eukprot:CAMPEP_0173386608 /NCGR_PEP_ID=MMETSP1356-20130122/9195_1 /TAXON_ID=77927 ORGANISM="Hemiselmis virescens, Strain PCC157" /NCGR_SAMPLE_ID=MMETSP1356 /ASSEMBLY_ACC=CAM_ASM_000847 /LENGTH=109 /DNA_ID=CAMNT_0014342905 /DNA_START=54 /DNA_END=380 /DNA_ORIENTATION=-
MHSDDDDDFELVIAPTDKKGDAECVPLRAAVALAGDASWQTHGCLSPPLLSSSSHDLLRDSQACARWSLLDAKWGKAPPPSSTPRDTLRTTLRLMMIKGCAHALRRRVW